MSPEQTGERNPEILSAEAGRLAMPFAVDTVDVFREEREISEIVERAGQVGVTSINGEIKVEPVEEIDAETENLLEGTDAPVRTLPPGYMQTLFRPIQPPRRRGGGGAWWHIKKYLNIPGISDVDDD